MKAKVAGVRVLVMHGVVLAGFSLMQGCTTGDAPVRWLNWPYNTPKDQPAVLPPVEATNAGLFPTDSAPIIDVSPVPSMPVVPSTAETVYRVQQGDKLSSISSMYGSSWKELADYNNLTNPNRLKVGQEIRIPGAAGVHAPVKRTSAPAVSSRPVSSSIKQGSSYVIQRGDSLSSIAKRSGLTVSEIKQANSLTSDAIVAGKSLTIPKKGEVKAPVKATSAPAKVAAPTPVKPAAEIPLPVPAPLADSTPAVSEATAPLAGSAPVPVVPEAAPVATAASVPVYDHVLYPGETLDDVARQYGSTKEAILKINPSITDPNSIKPGTKILVPIPE